jgi:biotin carboxyl carrier protein
MIAHRAYRSLGLVCTRKIASNRRIQAKIVEMVPALGESITEGSISKWTKNIGDKVAVDDVIVIIETDKVTVDIKSTNAGVLTGHLATDTVRDSFEIFYMC